MTITAVTTDLREATLAAIPFGRLLHVEWVKMTDTRAARRILGLCAVATAAIMLAPLLAKGSIDQTYSSYLTCSAVALTTLLPVVAILTFTSEWSQRTVLTTFTLEPRRIRVINAKVGVSLLLAVAAILLGAGTSVVALGIAAGTGRHLTNDLTAANTIGYAVALLFSALTAVAFGALLHNTSWAIVLFFAAPTIVALLASALRSAGDWVNPAVTSQWVRHGDWSGHTAKILVASTIWILLPLTAAMIRTVRSDIK